MIKVALVSSSLKDRGEYLRVSRLPENYMGDFSLMGFLVDQYEKAVALLLSYGCRVDVLNAGAEVFINGPNSIPEIQALLEKNNIRCDYSDIADTLYQA